MPIVFLTSGSPLLVGDAPGDAFGAALAGGHDIDGDGLPDLVVGAPGNDAAGAEAGAIYVYLGGTEGLASAWSERHLGRDGGALGTALVYLPDSNGDGYADLAAGAPGADRVCVYLGTATGLDDCASIAGTRSTEFGTALASGDFDGDGDGDLAVGAPGGDEARVFRGGPLGVTELRPTTLDGEFTGDGFGASLAGVPDVDGDGDDELAVGAPERPTRGDTGTAYLYLGAADGPSLDDGWLPTDGLDAEGWGSALAGGDFDGDGTYADHGSLLLDCDDDDVGRYPTAPEDDGDGVDADCDGQDDAPASTRPPAPVVIDFSTLPALRDNHCGFDPCPVTAFEEVWAASLASDCGRDEQAVGTVGPCESATGPVLVCPGEQEGWSVREAWTTYADNGVDCESSSHSVNTTVVDASLAAPTALGAVAARGRLGASASSASGTATLGWADGTTSRASWKAGSVSATGPDGTAYASDDGLTVVFDGASFTRGEYSDLGAPRWWFANGEVVAEVRGELACAGAPLDGVVLAIVGTEVRFLDDAGWLEVPVVDGDGDGWPVEQGDCDDANPDAYPCAEENGTDNVDEDCDGLLGVDADADGVDDGRDCDPADPAVGVATYHYADNDADTVGVSPLVLFCPGEGPWSDVDGDCDDNDATVRPGVAETCDERDNDCDGDVDEWATDAPDYWFDADRDGYGTEVPVEPDDPEYPCETPHGACTAQGDCNAFDPAVHPGARDVPGDGVDQDCDGADAGALRDEGGGGDGGACRGCGATGLGPRGSWVASAWAVAAGLVLASRRGGGRAARPTAPTTRSTAPGTPPTRR